MMEKNLTLGVYNAQAIASEATVRELNNRAINLLNGLIAFKERI